MLATADQASEMWDLFQQVVACDTAVRPGEHRVAADDPRLSNFNATVAGPALEALGATTHSDSAGNLIASFGEATGDETLFVTYPATHHGNDTDDPLRAREVVIDGTTHWVGQGVNEGKAPFVVLIDALRRVKRIADELIGRVIVAVSTEGSSTNQSSTVMFDELSIRPAAAVLMIGTGGRLALGHRGRVDLHIMTHGAPTHSSVGAEAPDAISRICSAERSVRRASAAWSAERTGRKVTPYRLICGPVAPHTMPARCELVLDCRYLAGDDVDDVRQRLAAAIADDGVTIDIGPVMLPAATEADSTLVARFQHAATTAGIDLRTFDPPWTFDGGPAHVRGIPVVLYGPSSDHLDTITGTDAVATDALLAASDLLTALLSN